MSNVAAKPLTIATPLGPKDSIALQKNRWNHVGDILTNIYIT